MRYLDKTTFHEVLPPFEITTVSEECTTQEGAHYSGVYLKQKTIRCSICKKVDKLAVTCLDLHKNRPTHMPPIVVYVLYAEIHIDGDTWKFIPKSHAKCVEINSMGLLL